MLDFYIEFNNVELFQKDLDNIHGLIMEEFSVIKYIEDKKDYWIKQKNSKYIWSTKNGITTYMETDLILGIADNCIEMTVAVFNDSFHVDLKSFVKKLSIKHEVCFMDDDLEPAKFDEYKKE